MVKIKKMLDFPKACSEVYQSFLRSIIENKHFNLEKTEPNKVTVTRICFTPILLISIILTFRYSLLILLDALLLTVGGLTDGIDGMLAREYAKNRSKERCRIGKWLDSAADKLLSFSFFWPAYFYGVIDIRLFWLLFSLESFLFLTGTYIALKGETWEKENDVHLGSNFSGKWKFTFELICGGFIFLYIISLDKIIYYSVQASCLVAIILAALSIRGHLRH